MEPTEPTTLSPADELEQIEAERRTANEQWRAREKEILAKLDEQAERAREELTRIEALRERARASVGEQAANMTASHRAATPPEATPRKRPRRAAKKETKAAPVTDEVRRRRKLTNRELILECLREHPGHTVRDVLAWIQKYKPKTKVPTIQGEMWRMSRKKPLSLRVEEGDQGRQRYYVLDGRGRHPEQNTVPRTNGAAKNGESAVDQIKATLRANPSTIYTAPQLAKLLGVDVNTVSHTVSDLERKGDVVMRVARGQYRCRKEKGEVATA
jgi:hypothetical protein